ncbi:ASPARAGINYL tRNA SYNTHETASE [Encephalitozoon cuniculi GB-M1]|uniref:Probable asparagine--tRNA ligase, cytoplasmic n=2 Tax=Encephalitozoon cuniculi TaxID=6035 RepID=SYNC_ENCCU|nr:asparagine--tRNA ligase DED81 [Encephalitozoon cuniculi GB-M1]Q8SQK8.2 RecName: Full=Probable asparagine--tRNA ligase, cytoplasmic; AltName: Full=Asparaginyl-tRNA synthetase; Short=AsnRS [Encephalitozoon cuniculi GB-M1]KMV65348.1 asparaginyl-tRNA synthetase [Encephalitozoon cuniculi EcunIII-L]UYI26863.1 asparagine-tRNA ligase [Encephalitozoon cuniculi]CAD27140.2 ASPARAGINYL tRNA SYNTHETASE [Encephalitozoon cuniculi GB-M1]
MSEKVEKEIGEQITKLDLSEYRSIELSKLSKENIGQKIRTFGWVANVRSQSTITFIELYAHYRTVKCVYQKKMHLTMCTSMTVYGTVSKNFGKKDAHEFEIQVEGVEIYNGAIAPSFPLNEDSSVNAILTNGHLGLRTKKRQLFLKARGHLLKIIRDFYFEGEYTEVTPPTMVQTQVEGGSTLFKLDYYGEDAYLTQSSQLYLETVVPASHRAYCIMPSYRAEKSRTRRHLSEYTHVEAEMADIDLDGLISSIEALVSYSMRRFYEEMKSDILSVFPEFEFHKVPRTPFKRIKYSEAIELLKSKGYKKEDNTDFELGDDIPDAAERYLVEVVGDGCPVFLTHFLVGHKPFYMRKDENDKGLTESTDLLFPGIGEILGGSMRQDTYEDLIEGFRRENINIDPYYWYLDMARFGPCKHGGYGLGFERFLMGLMRYESVDEATLYPRKVSRCQP